MKTIYLDSDFKCHVIADGTMLGVQTERFDGKCDAFIEGYRFVPAGLKWTRSDGAVFYGEMIAPWKEYRELASAQTQYELDLAVLDETIVDYEYQLALTELGITE